ncbi:hypothetical protein K474DRAFT_1713277 [Panus rudis PR-1116 ss-1]|nr:hypothetical protein K474DRAFT_1713277 [Panus rudis PR-1116 ss-1]
MISEQRKHGHMHTRETPGINVGLATDLDEGFVWTPPLTVTDNIDRNNAEELMGPEGITEEELDEYIKELNVLAKQTAEADGNAGIDPLLLEDEALEVDQVYSFEELEKVDKGIEPTPLKNTVRAADTTTSGEASWDVDFLLASKGLLEQSIGVTRSYLLR